MKLSVFNSEQIEFGSSQFEGGKKDSKEMIALGMIAEHQQLVEGQFWRRVPAFSEVNESTFGDYYFQLRQTSTRPEHLIARLRGLVSEAFVADLTQGLTLAPMSLRISPYLLSLIDWDDPYNDPIRIQFLPLASCVLPDHPLLRLDSLSERGQSPVDGLVHRYRDKALFLALDTECVNDFETVLGKNK